MRRHGFRYSKGFGVVRYLLGEEHLLNVPNCVTGIVFYTLQFILGRPNYNSTVMMMMMMIDDEGAGKHQHTLTYNMLVALLLLEYL